MPPAAPPGANGLPVSGSGRPIPGKPMLLAPPDKPAVLPPAPWASTVFKLLLALAFPVVPPRVAPAVLPPAPCASTEFRLPTFDAFWADAPLVEELKLLDVPLLLIPLFGPAGTSFPVGPLTGPVRLPVLSNGFVVPVEFTGFVVPVEFTGFVVPVETTGFVVPVDATGLVVPVEFTGFVVPVELTGFVVPVEATGLVVPVELTGFVVPVELTGFVVPVASPEVVDGDGLPATALVALCPAAVIVAVGAPMVLPAVIVLPGVAVLPGLNVLFGDTKRLAEAAPGAFRPRSAPLCSRAAIPCSTKDCVGVRLEVEFPVPVPKALFPVVELVTLVEFVPRADVPLDALVAVPELPFEVWPTAPWLPLVLLEGPKPDRPVESSAALSAAAPPELDFCVFPPASPSRPWEAPLPLSAPLVWLS